MIPAGCLGSSASHGKRKSTITEEKSAVTAIPNVESLLSHFKCVIFTSGCAGWLMEWFLSDDCFQGNMLWALDLLGPIGHRF